MATQKFNSIQLVSVLAAIVSAAVLVCEAYPNIGIVSRLFNKPSKSLPPMNAVSLIEYGEYPEPIKSVQSMTQPKDMETLRLLGAYVEQKTVKSATIEAPKPVVVDILLHMLGNVGELSYDQFDSIFREKFLRPCKNAHVSLKESWWDVTHRKSECKQLLFREWLTIKKACKLIVLSVDSDRANLVKDTYEAYKERAEPANQSGLA